MTVNNRTQLHQLVDTLPDSLLTEVIHFVEFLLFKLQSPELPMAVDDGDKPTQTDSDDFFSYAGLWADREISQTTIRERAWSEQIAVEGRW